MARVGKGKGGSTRARVAGQGQRWLNKGKGGWARARVGGGCARV